MGGAVKAARDCPKVLMAGLRGGPLMHTVAAKAVALGEALHPEFKLYAHQVVANARTLAAALADAGLAIVFGGTDNHLMLVDPRSAGVIGRAGGAGDAATEASVRERVTDLTARFPIYEAA